METTQSIKSRANTINNLSKALEAIKLVSSARLSGFRKKPDRNNLRKQKIAQMIRIVEQKMREFDFVRLSTKQDKQTSKKSLIVILSTKQGFCGPLNQFITNEYKKLLHNTKVKNEVITEVCGTKHRSFASRDSLKNLDLRNTSESAKKIKNLVFHYIQREFVDEAYLVYGFTKNAINQSANVEKIFPIYDADYSGHKNNALLCFSNIEIEGDLIEMHNKLMEMYSTIVIGESIKNHVIAELSARTNCLDSSVKNATEIYDNLSQMYNKTRQAKITQELTEIISSTECIR